VSFAESGDLLHLGDAADVGDRGADVVDVVGFDELVEVPAAAPFLSRREGNRRDLAELGDVFEEGFGADGVFDQIGLEVFQELAAAFGIGVVEALVEVDEPVTVLADAFADFLAVSEELVDALVGVVDIAAALDAGGVGAEGAEALGDDVGGAFLQGAAPPCRGVALAVVAVMPPSSS